MHNFYSDEKNILGLVESRRDRGKEGAQRPVIPRKRNNSEPFLLC